MTEYQVGDEVAPTPTLTPKKTPIAPKKQDRTTLALLFIAAFVAVGGIGFAFGHLTAPSATAAANPTGGGRVGFGGCRALPSLAPGQTFDTSQFGGGAGGRGLGSLCGSGQCQRHQGRHERYRSDRYGGPGQADTESECIRRPQWSYSDRQGCPDHSAIGATRASARRRRRRPPQPAPQAVARSGSSCRRNGPDGRRGD